MKMAVKFYRTHNMVSVPGHCQLARSLERILEEAQISGELKLSNRKLKEFPRAATKYDLSDIVVADLSRNRFCDLPEETTSFPFLETLLLYHNTLRSLPQSVKGLTSLTYLDLRSNHLCSLPRELCFLPLKVLLVAHNRLTSLPDEFGRLRKLTDLDVSCNQIANLPARIGDLKSLRSLSLRSNQLVYLPREITFLSLVSLDISNNRISSLPNEIRQMSTLVTLKLENNPLTLPPVNLCVRGLVHILKYLETQSFKDERMKSGGTADGFVTLRRIPRNDVIIIDDSKLRRHHVDSGYCTSDGLDKRWVQDISNGILKNGNLSSKSSPSLENFVIYPDSPACANDSNNIETSESNDCGKKNSIEIGNQKTENILRECNSENTSQTDDLTPESQKNEKSNKQINNIQTYREYKEALKQQRNQIVPNVYKKKDQHNANHENIESCTDNIISNPPLGLNCLTQDIPDHKDNIDNCQAFITKNGTVFDENVMQIKKPIQKVTPSRNLQSKTEENVFETNNECCDYTKPSSPIKCNGAISRNHTIVSNKTEYSVKSTKLKLSRKVSWNKDTPAEQLSFTMRREFDKQKEETELIAHLRNIIETCLKMNLPEDIASALTDGVILCHLANYVRPRSVASIHVPSPGVPKLTMARCRRNVDNFLEACRKIGVDEELICSCADVVNNKETVAECFSKRNAVYGIISALLSIAHDQQHQHGDEQTPATNSNATGQPETKQQQSSIHIGNGSCSLTKDVENLICCAADVLEGKGTVQIAVTVGEIFRLQEGQKSNVKSPTRISRCNGSTFSTSATS